MESVVENISADLPHSFALVFDAGSSGRTHYITSFAAVGPQNINRYSTSLHGFTPLWDENCFDSEEHNSSIKSDLSVYEETMDNVAAIIGYNFVTNKSIDELSGKWFIGPASHCHNLAVEDVLEEELGLLQKIRVIMKKLRYLKRLEKRAKSIGFQKYTLFKLFIYL